MAKRPELKFATFNLHNLQLPGQPMYHGNTYDNKTYNSKIAWTASMLGRLDADVIGFQELWHPDALRDAFKAAGLDQTYTIVSKLFPGKIGAALAVRSTHKVLAKKWITQFPKELILKKRKPAPGEPDYEISVAADHFSRAVLRVKVRPKQGSKKPPDIVFYVAHLKSKLAMRLDKQEAKKPSVKKHSTAIGSALSTIRRAAEAAALRVMLTKEMKGTNTPVVVIGDLNDAELSVTTSIISADPSYRLYAASRAGQTSDIGLYAVASLQEYRSLRHVYYTHVHKGRRESLDHILVSEQFYDYSRKRRWSFKEMRILNDHLDEEGDKALSDHGVMCATFVFHPAK
jgi:predicted extracellular nuclease